MALVSPPKCQNALCFIFCCIPFLSNILKTNITETPVIKTALRSCQSKTPVWITGCNISYRQQPIMTSRDDLIMSLGKFLGSAQRMNTAAIVPVILGI